MSKKLYIVRHAKSSWENSNISDFERPLLPIGIEKTEKIIQYLHKMDVKLDLIISSPAVRAYETAKLIAISLNYPLDKMILDERIYEASTSDLIQVIAEQPAEANSIMLVGHNPSLTYLSNLFLTESIDNLPTTGVVSIKFYCNNWAEIVSANKITNFVAFPRMFMNK